MEEEIQPQTYTIHQLSSYLQIHTGTLYRMAKKGELPGFKVGTDWRFDKRSIDEWIAKQRGAKNDGEKA